MLLTAGISLQYTCIFHVCILYHCEKGRSLNSRPAWYTMIVSGHPKVHTHTHTHTGHLKVHRHTHTHTSGTLEMRWENHAHFLKDHSLYSEFQDSQRFIMGLFFKIKIKKEIISKSNKHDIFGITNLEQ